MNSQKRFVLINVADNSAVLNAANVLGLYLNWQRWWAWRPVRTISNQWVWLTWCYRRRRRFGPGSVIANVQYATIFDVLNTAV